MSKLDLLGDVEEGLQEDHGNAEHQDTQNVVCSEDDEYNIQPLSEASVNLPDEGGSVIIPSIPAADPADPKMESSSSEVLHVENPFDVHGDIGGLQDDLEDIEGPETRDQALTSSELMLVAVCNNDVQNVERFLQEGANPNFDFREGGPALLRVLPDNHFLSKLARYYYSLSRTALHHAASYALEGCTKLLLDAGADPDICDDELRTPLDVVGSSIFFGMTVDTTRSFPEVIRLIRQEDGSHNTMRLGGLNNVLTPLHTAVELENDEAFKELINMGASVCCHNEEGETPLHVCTRKQYMEPFKIIANAYRNNAYRLSKIIDVQDRLGYTVLHSAICADWSAGAYIALESGADVVKMANDGETPLHTAAAKGNIDVLKQILRITRRDITECKNGKAETALFKAMFNANYDCVKEILNYNDTMDDTTVDGLNVIHLAAMNNNKDILQLLLNTYGPEIIVYKALERLSARDGFGPIHYAVSKNNLDMVKILANFVIRNDARRIITLKTGNPQVSPVIFEGSTPLHIAAVYNHARIAEFLIYCDRTIIDETNSVNEVPLHTAINHSSRDVIKVLLCRGENLLKICTSDDTNKRNTAIDMIVNNLSNPTKFLENVFDSFISTNNSNFLDPECKVIIDFRILTPGGTTTDQMNVIEALLDTGNRYGQDKLLVHPLVESFLHLKWKALLPFFYTIIAFDAFFVTSLTIFSLSHYFYKDTGNVKPACLNSTAWGSIVFLSIFLILWREILLFKNVKRRRHFFQIEIWVKLCSLGLASILLLGVVINDADWLRLVATWALLLAWIQMMILLSRFPNWGFYVLMFGKVAYTVVTILLSFTFLLIGFSLSFMIQFHNQEPFDGPISAFIKTIVMMTSEFEYSSLFDEDQSKRLAFSFQIARIIFVVFLVLAAIVLMNLMVGVAVSDINNLQLFGNIRRLDKQVEFLSTLDALVYNKFFTKIFPKNFNSRLRGKRTVSRKVLLWPGLPRSRKMILPETIQDAIINIAQAQKKRQEGSSNVETMLREIHAAIVHKTLKDDTYFVNTNEEIYYLGKPGKSDGIDELKRKMYCLDVEIASIKDRMAKRFSALYEDEN